MELVKVINNDIQINNDFIEQYRNFKKTKLAMDLMEKQFKEEVKNAMEQLGKDKLILNGFCASIKAPYERKTIDSARLKKELPDIAEEYTTKTMVASSITISVE